MIFKKVVYILKLYVWVSNIEEIIGETPGTYLNSINTPLALRKAISIMKITCIPN